MISFTEDLKEIDDLLSEVTKCEFNDFKRSLNTPDITKTTTLKKDYDYKLIKPTEPNDYPFRVRKISRSFSISDEQLLSTTKTNNDSNYDSVKILNSSEPKIETESKFKFILIRRSRSLGHIFLPDITSDKIEKKFNEELSK